MEMNDTWRSCPDCSARMPENAAFCPGCGRSMQSATPESPHTLKLNPSEGKVGLLPENIAGALAYLSFVPAIVFLLVEPFKKSEFVRFHSIQCLLCWGVGLLLGVVLKLAGGVFFMVPLAGPLLVLLLDVLVILAAFLIWLILIIKAFRGEAFKLPLAGGLAEHLADTTDDNPAR
jgi:uncharacterized membrane protein